MASLVRIAIVAGILALFMAAPVNGVAGQAVRGVVEALAPVTGATGAAGAVSGQSGQSNQSNQSGQSNQSNQSGQSGGLEQAAEPAGAQTRQGLGAADQNAEPLGEGMGKSSESGQTSNAASGQTSNAPSSAAAHGAGLGGSSLTWGGYAQAVGILFLLVALLWLVVWLVRRFGKFNFLPRPGALPKGALVMEAQLPLGPRKGLMVVRFLNRRLLLGVTDQHITLLTEEQAQHEPQNKDFQHVMEEVSRGADSR